MGIPERPQQIRFLAEQGQARAVEPTKGTQRPDARVRFAPPAPIVMASSEAIARATKELADITRVGEDAQVSGIALVQGGSFGQEKRARGMKRKGLSMSAVWGNYTVHQPDGTQEVYLEHHPDHRFQLMGKTRPDEEGVWKEVWSAPEGRRGKRHLLHGPEKVGETAEVASEGGPDGQQHDAIVIYSKEALKRREEEKAKQEQDNQQALDEHLGEFGRFFKYGEWEGKGKDPKNDREAVWIKANLNREAMSFIAAQEQREKTPQPKAYTNLTVRERVQLVGRSLKELVLPNNMGSARTIGQSLASTVAFELMLLPTPLPVKTVAGIFTAINLATLIIPQSLRTQKLQRERSEKLAPTLMTLSDKFRDFQAEHIGTSFIEQVKLFNNELYVQTHKDRYEQLRFRNPNLSHDELVAKLKRRGLAKGLAAGMIPLGLVGFLGYTGIVALADHFGASLIAPNYYDMYHALGNMIHVGHEYVLAAGFATYYTGMQIYNGIVRLPDAVTRARKTVQVEKEKRESRM